MALQRPTDVTLMCGAALLLLSGVGLFVVLGEVAAALVLPPNPVTPRVLAVLFISLLLLALASYVLRAKSVLWQVPLQAFAAATLAIGAAAVVVSLFQDWRLLLSGFGLKATVCLFLGIATAWLMRHLQARLLPEQDA